MNNLNERRRFPRAKKQLALKIKAEGFDFVTQTENVSCIGAYCSVNKHIPIMTRLSLILLLPMRSGEKNTTAKIQCKGVVVRSESLPDGRHNIAIFFNEINERNKDKIAQYINQHIV
jgi:hypothetical protein